MSNTYYEYLEKLEVRGECTFEPVDFLDEVACSECRKVIGTVADTQQMKYCPYCGKRRVDV